MKKIICFIMIIGLGIHLTNAQSKDSSAVKVIYKEGSNNVAQKIPVIIKFKDESNIRIRNNKITDFDKNILGSELKQFLNNGKIERMHKSTSEEELDKLHNNAEKNLGKKISDLNNYFIYFAKDTNEYNILSNLLSKCNSIDYFKISTKTNIPLPDNYQPKQFYLDNGQAGVNATTFWNAMNTKGTGIKIVDVEQSINLNHKDFPSITEIYSPYVKSTDELSISHGTSVCGIIASLNNGWGTTGIAYDCNYNFVPVTVELYAIPDGIQRAINATNEGDFILIEQEIPGPNCHNCSSSNQVGYVSVEWDKACYDIIITAVGNGRIVIEPAGNGSQNLDDPIYAQGNNGHYPFLSENNSGAIIVGAGQSDQGYDVVRSRIDFSNYGSRVDLQGVGNSLWTTSYNISSSDPNYDYTTFGGTSGAAPVVAGAGILVQSKYKQVTGTVLSPSALKNALYNTGKAQQSGTYPVSQNIGPLPNAVAAIQSLLQINCTDNFESNNSVASSTLVFASPLNDGSSDSTLQANIGYVGDQDWYKININHSGILKINLSNLPNNYDLEFYGPNGLSQWLDGSYNTGTANEQINYTYSGSSTTVYAKVYANNSSDFTTATCYNLQFIWTPSIVSNGCNGKTTLTSNSGTFEDGSGNSDYANNLDCSWLIQPNGATDITLSFSNFDVSNPGDTVFIYNGSSTSSSRLLASTGNNIPPSVKSTGSTMLVRFVTDGSNTAAGWTANYTSTTQNTGTVGIVKYEYWFDYNYSGRMQVGVAPVSILNLIRNIPTNTLQSGLHIFNIRFKDEKNLWSSTMSQYFYKMPLTSGNNNIISYEYWFDNDYAGKVSQAGIGQNTMDLITSIDSKGVTNGLHIFNIRFKDSRGLWSSLVSQHFYKMPATTALNNIVTYEYWFDNDYAGKITKATNPESTLNLITDIDAKSIKTGLHVFNIRFKDEWGLWSSTVSQYFYDTGILPGKNYINGFRYWVDNKPSTITNVNLPVTTNPRYILTNLNLANLDTGKHVISLQFRDLKHLWSCAVADTFLQMGKPRLDKIVPNKGGNTGDVTTMIYGTGFYEGTKARLTRNGFADIVVPDSLINISYGQRINTTFNLRGKEVGLWNVVVEIPGDTVMTLVNGFKIEEGNYIKPWASVQGFNLIRLNQWQNYSIICGNDANIDAKGVPIWIAVPQNSEIKLKFKFAYHKGNFQTYDTTASYFLTDTVLSEQYKAKVYCVILPYLPAHTIKTLNFNLKVSATNNYKIVTWASMPLFGSPLKYIMSECWTDMLELITDVSPQVSCIYDGFTTALDPFFDMFLDPTYGTNDYTVNYIWESSKVIFECTGAVFGINTKAFKLVSRGLEGMDYLQDCLPPFLDAIFNNFYFRSVTSYDPNIKIGPYGAGNKNYYSNQYPYTYTIHFANADTATANVQKVKIIDTLDLNLFDINTLQLGYISFGDTIINLPNGNTSFTSDIDLRPKGNNLIVHIDAGVDEATGVLKWEFTSLDPITLEGVEDPMAGFLPPNKTAPEGEGSVFYSIKVKDSTSNNSVVKNKAYIYFDNNDAVPTKYWTNTIDNIKPQSKVDSLPPVTKDTIFTVKWEGSDVGSGIKDYTIYCSVNDNSFKIWKLHTSLTSGTFSGKIDSLYKFYSIAVDSAGNIELLPIKADAQTIIAKPGTDVFKISGIVTYDNPQSTPMNNTKVYLKTLEGKVIDSTNTDNTGFYSINEFKGTYIIYCKTKKEAGGIDPIDALLTNRNYVKSYSFQDSLEWKAADVTGDTIVMPDDAYLINNKYVKILKQFAVGDWIFDNHTFNINNKDTVINIKALCFGDVDGSRDPSTPKLIPDIIIKNEGALKIKAGEVFDLPVKITKDLVLGAVGFEFKVQSSKFKVISVKSDLKGMIYNIINDEVYLAWAAKEEGIKLKTNDVLCTLVLKLNNDKEALVANERQQSQQSVGLLPESILTDYDARKLSGELLSMPDIEFYDEINEFSYSCYPNPMNQSSVISYQLPGNTFVNISVYDLLGNKIATLVDENKETGKYEIVFDARSMPEGIYIYKVVAGKNEGEGKMVVMR